MQLLSAWRLEMNKLQKTEKEYATFDDLDFQLLPKGRACNPNAKNAQIEFENGWGVSVVTDFPEYTNGYLFEIQVLRDGKFNYESEITNDVKRFNSISELNDCLLDIQDLDENGVIQRPKDKNRDEIKRHIERRKAQIKMARNLRKQIEKQKVSDVALADEIAKDKISGREKRTITPEVGMAIRHEKALEK